MRVILSLTVPYQGQLYSKMWEWFLKVDKCRERTCQSEELLFMFKNFTATCFGSRIINHHQVDKVLKKRFRVEHLISFYACREALILQYQKSLYGKPKTIKLKITSSFYKSMLNPYPANVENRVSS
jgi:hypothetical protein